MNPGESATLSGLPEVAYLQSILGLLNVPSLSGSPSPLGGGDRGGRRARGRPRVPPAASGSGDRTPARRSIDAAYGRSDALGRAHETHLREPRIGNVPSSVGSGC